jgi:hypothetical protein
MATRKVERSANNGRFVKTGTADRLPNTTVTTATKSPLQTGAFRAAAAKIR